MSAKNGKSFFLPSSDSAKRQLSVIRACVDARIPYNLEGDPGTGKSSLLNALAISMDYEVLTVIGRHMHPVDAAGLPIVIHTDPENPVTVKALPDWFRKALRVKRIILFFDEFGNTSSATQAALLVFIQERMMGGIKLPDETVIIMASNPIASGSDGHPLTRPMANRIVHGVFNPAPEDWFEGMACQWNEPASDRLVTERARITAFLHQNVILLDQGPKDEVEESGAHPTRRSWDNLARLLSFVDLDDPDNQKTRDTLTIGTIGHDAHLLFSVWDSQMNLPDIQGIIDDPESFDWVNEEPDRVYAVLSIITGTAKPKDAEGVAKVFIAAGQTGARQDIGAGMVTSIIGLISSLGDAVSGEYMDKLTDTYMPVLMGSGISGGRR